MNHIYRNKHNSQYKTQVCLYKTTASWWQIMLQHVARFQYTTLFVCPNSPHSFFLFTLYPRKPFIFNSPYTETSLIQASIYWIKFKKRGVLNCTFLFNWKTHYIYWKETENLKAKTPNNILLWNEVACLLITLLYWKYTICLLQHFFYCRYRNYHYLCINR